MKNGVKNEATPAKNPGSLVRDSVVFSLGLFTDEVLVVVVGSVSDVAGVVDGSVPTVEPLLGDAVVTVFDGAPGLGSGEVLSDPGTTPAVHLA